MEGIPLGMYRERLQQVSGRVGGDVILSLVAKDGIPVDTVGEAVNLDFDALVAEFMSQVQSLGTSHRELDVGELSQMTITTDRFAVIVSALTSEYYLFLVTEGELSRGRALFELRRARSLFESDL